MIEDATEQLAIETGQSVLLGRIALFLAGTTLVLGLALVIILATQTDELQYMGVEMAGTAKAGVIGPEIVSVKIEPILTHFVNFTHSTVDHHYGAVARSVHPATRAHFDAWSEIERDYIKTSRLSSAASVGTIHVEPDTPITGFFTVKAWGQRDVTTGSAQSGAHDIYMELIVKPEHVGDLMLLYVVAYEVPQHSDAQAPHYDTRY